MAEMLMGKPLFQGKNSADQLVEIIKVLGTPTLEQVHTLNEQYKDFKFPQIKAVPWSSIIPLRAGADAIDLISKLLKYTPKERIGLWEAMNHPYFDELRDPQTKLPNGNPLPSLFDYSEAGNSEVVEFNFFVISIRKD